MFTVSQDYTSMYNRWRVLNPVSSYNTSNSMPFPIAAAAIGAGASLLGNIFGASNQARQIRAQKELAQFQFDKNVEMWNMQNEYNTPSAQMERLKAAGLNPNLVYGNGSVTGNTTSNAPQFEAPNIRYNFIPSLNGFLSVLGAYQDYKLKDAQRDVALQTIEESKSRQALNDSTAVLNGIRGNNLNIQGSLWESQRGLNEYNLGRSQRFEPYQLQALQYGNQNTYADTLNKIAQEARTRQEMQNIPFARALMQAQANYYNQSAYHQKQLGKKEYYDNFYWNSKGLNKNPTTAGLLMNGISGLSTTREGVWNFIKPGGTADSWLYPNVIDPVDHAFSKALNFFGKGFSNAMNSASNHSSYNYPRFR